MTLPLIKVSDHDHQFNFDEIAKRMVDTGGRQAKLRFGSDSVSFAAGTEGTKAVSHGLGSTPVAAFAIPVLATTQFLDVGVRSGATSTSVTFQFTAGAVLTATFTFYWLAIG